MKTLILVRHAKSSWTDPTLSDHNRPLNERGRRDAPFMGKILAERGIRPDAIFSSSAVRALETAKCFARAFGREPDSIAVRPEIYHADSESMLELIAGLDDAFGTVLVFGHNPTFTELANLFTDRHLDNLPTCGIFAVGFAVDHWSEVKPRTGTFLFQEFPRTYFPKDALD